MGKKRNYQEPNKRPENVYKGFWLWGIHACKAALLNPQRYCHLLMATEAALKTLGLSPSQIKCPVKPIKLEELDAFLPKQTVHQGIALKVEPLIYPDLEDFCKTLPGQSIFVVFDQLTDPHNIGAILRTAAALGAAGAIMTERHSPPLSGALAKAASGALERLPIFKVTNLVQGLDRLKSYGYWIIGLDETATKSIKDVSPPQKIALVLGAEGEGLRHLTKANCDFLLKIPTCPEFPTLNVSIAAAISLYEVRQALTAPS